MSSKYKVKKQAVPHFITITIIDWLDLFSKSIYKHIIIDALKYCRLNKELRIHAYVIMTSHIHLIVSCEYGHILEDIIRDFKKHTSKEFIKAIVEQPESRREWLLNKFSFAAKRIKRGVNYKVWKDGFHPIELATTKMIKQRLNYIHNNPVEEEIVNHPEDYKFSSADNYTGGLGLLDIDLI